MVLLMPLKKDKNEIQKLSEAYDHIVKKHNNYYKNLKVKTGKGLRRVNVYDYDEQNGYYYEVKNPKVKIKKLETTEEKLNKIYDKYGIGGKTIKGRIERKKISDTVVAYHNNLNRVNTNKRLNKHDKQINVLEEINKQQNKDLEELRKDLENFKKEKERQNEQIQMLQAMLKELQSRGNISQTQLTSQRTNSVATQTPQKAKEVHAQNLSDRFKGLEMIEISEAKDAEEEQIRTPLATGTSNEVAAKSQIVENRAEEDSEIEDNRISDIEDIKEKDKKVKPKQFQDLPDRPKNVVRLKLPKRNDTIKEEEIQISLKSQSLDSGIAHLRDKNKRVKEAHKEIEAKTQKRGLASKSMP